MRKPVKKPLKPLMLGALCLAALMLPVLLLPLGMDHVMAGTLNTVTSFTDNPQPQEEDPLTASTVPPTAEPSPTAVAAGTSTMPPIRLLPSPQPVEASPIEHLPMLQPTDWHQLMRPAGPEALDGLEAAMATWTELERQFSLPKEGLSIHQIAPGRFLLEELLPLNLAHRKLIKGIADNLTGDSIYVPDQTTLNRVLKLSLHSLLLGDTGGADLLTTHGSTLPLAAFAQHVSAGGASLMTPQEYLDLRSTMIQQAHQQVFDHPEDSAQRSRALIAQLMQGEQPMTLSVLRMEPYAAQENWAYYLAGHHLHCVDMKDGRNLTITTDLISDRMVGFATEGAEPFIKTYARLMDQSEALKDRSNQEVRAQVKAHASELIDQLSGEKLSQKPEQWSLQLNYLYAPEWQKGYWALRAQPADALAGALDPEGSLMPSYTLELDEDLSLRSWFTGYLGEHEMTSSYLPEKHANDWFAEQSTRYGATHGALIDNLQELMTDQDQMAARAAADLSQRWKSLLAERLDNIGIITVKAAKGQPEPSLVFTLHAVGEDGIRYRIECILNPHHQLTYRSIYRQYELPPGASELKG